MKDETRSWYFLHLMLGKLPQSFRRKIASRSSPIEVSQITFCENKTKMTKCEPRGLGKRVRQWNLKRAVAAKARRPRGKRIHSSTLLQKILRQSRLSCGTPTISSANARSVRSVGLTRGDIGVAGCHVERSRACLCQHRATLTNINHALGVDSTISG